MFDNAWNELHDNYAIENYNGQKFAVWKSLAFETVCFNHLNEIKAKLGISGVSSIGFFMVQIKRRKRGSNRFNYWKKR